MCTRIVAAARAHRPARGLRTKTKHENGHIQWVTEVHCHTVGFKVWLALGSRLVLGAGIFEKPCIPEGAWAHLVVVCGGAAQRGLRAGVLVVGSGPVRPRPARGGRTGRARRQGAGWSRRRRLVRVRRVERDAAGAAARRVGRVAGPAQGGLVGVGQGEGRHVAHAGVWAAALEAACLQLPHARPRTL